MDRSRAEGESVMVAEWGRLSARFCSYRSVRLYNCGVVAPVRDPNPRLAPDFPLAMDAYVEAVSIKLGISSL
jgi:hypothetical protein